MENKGKDIISPYIIEKIKTGKYKQDMSVTNLCDLSNISRQTYYNVIGNKHSVSVNVLERLCNALDIKITIGGDYES